ncbi:hypothetical protein HJG43_10310 [Kineosporiaceae bacterium SCSIO 59966]|nr:hypothetical protein HJG43_10310 [Kineosporiaceae bacterium SCSIO 59966]
MARTPRSSEVEVPTSQGPARVRLSEPAGRPVGRLVLGHGAGGGVDAPDLLAVRDAAVAAGWEVALVVQPWKVAGRRVATAPARLDAAWTEVLRALPARGPLVVGGRSAGARVACRTAADLDAVGVCCLAFPLHPPGRPDRSRAGELPDDRPVLVVQGRRDPFGSPDDVRAAAPHGRAEVEVVAVDGNHALAADPDAVAGAVVAWLQRLRNTPGRGGVRTG